jgi:hypothetical protein
MMATTALWDKFRAAQRAKNGDASLAYKNAIECANKDKEVDAAWWEKQGDMAVNDTVAIQKV